MHFFAPLCPYRRYARLFNFDMIVPCPTPFFRMLQDVRSQTHSHSWLQGAGELASLDLLIPSSGLRDDNMKGMISMSIG